MEISTMPSEKKSVKHQYSKDDLLAISTHPLAKKLPACLELPINKTILSGRSKWDSDLNDRKRFESPVDEEFGGDKKSRLDPKDRIKKEHDVVLSPQRRSFNTGCFVTPQHYSSSNRRLDNTVKDRYERRRFERRNESHEKERVNNVWERNSRYNNNDRRRYDTRTEEEPEWFSGGPTSQHDTIELRGFEEEPKSKKKNENSKANSKLRKSSDTNISSNSREKVDTQTKRNSKNKSPEITKSESPKPEAPKNEVKKISPEPKPVTQLSNDFENIKINSDFNLDEFLNFDSISNLLPISNGCQEETSGSKFSQFFRKESPSPQLENLKSQENVFNSISDMKRTHISIPPEGNNYFSPISPAATSSIEPRKTAAFLELLQRSNKNPEINRNATKSTTIKDLEVSGKVQSLEEVEARIRQQQGISKPNDINKEDELNLFKKLLQPKVMTSEQHSHFTMPNPSVPINHQQDALFKLIQTRNPEVYPNMMQPNRLTPHPPQFNVPPPLPILPPEIQMLINNSQTSQEIFQHPEAQQLIRSLNKGDITILYLIELLKNSLMGPPLRRDMIASIIKMELQQRRVAVQRVPSPRDLQVHTQGIMQSALLKKMLEEQKENYKKRQELQRARSPNINTSLSPAKTTSPTPLIFTPTSVLRKMTAEKEPELMKPPQELNQNQDMTLWHMQHQRPPPTQYLPPNNFNTMIKPQQGRPIVKGGNIFTPPVPAFDYSNIPSQYRATPIPPQSQYIPQQTNRVRNLPNFVATPPPQQWMNAQINYTPSSNQRNLRSTNTFMNFQTNQGNQSVGNNLSKWFSPELLEKARAGKLPDIPAFSPTQTMLSVEELERQSVRNNK